MGLERIGEEGKGLTWQARSGRARTGVDRIGGERSGVATQAMNGYFNQTGDHHE